MDYSFITDSMIWSYSRLTTFERCKYLFLLHYILAEEESNRGFYGECGTLMHRLIAEFYQGERTLEQCVEEFDNEFPTLQARSSFVKPTTRQNYYESCIRSLGEMMLPPGEIVEVEQAHYFELKDGSSFVGIIDCVYRTPDGVVLRDHKSRALKERGERRIRNNELIDEMLRQLYLYAIPVFRKYGEYPKFLEFNLYRLGQVIREPFDLSKLKAAEDWAVELIARIKANTEWSPNLDWFQCTQLCGYTGTCDYKLLAG